MRAGDSEDGEEIVSRYLEDRLRGTWRATGRGALRVTFPCLDNGRSWSRSLGK